MRPLDREVGRARHAVRDVGEPAARLLGQVGDDPVDPRRRRAQPVVLGREAEDGQVVDHPAGVVDRRAVQDAAIGEAPDVVDQHRVEERLGLAALHVDGALVVDVVHPGRRPRRDVLGLGRREPERGVEADPVDDLGPQRHELVVVRRVAAGHRLSPVDRWPGRARASGPQSGRWTARRPNGSRGRERQTPRPKPRRLDRIEVNRPEGRPTSS